MVWKALLCAVILIGILFDCLAKPTSSAGTTQSCNENEIVKVSDNVANIIPDKDDEYRARYATQMLSYMNRTVEPCDDFYEYACGNWNMTIKPRQTDHKRGNLIDIDYKLNDIAEVILQRAHINDVAPEYADIFELSKKFYKNCLEANIYPMRKSLEYLDVVKEIGGFPAIDPQWNASNFNWLNMSAHMSNYAAGNLIKEMITPQYPFEPYFMLPDFGFDIELHHDTICNKSSNAYKDNKKLMHHILTVYDVDEQQRDHIVNDIFEFLHAILNVTKKFNEDIQMCNLLSLTMEDSQIVFMDELWITYYEIAWMNESGLYDLGGQPCAYLYYEVHNISNKHKEAVANYLSMKFLYSMDARLKDGKFQKDYCIAKLRKSMAFFFDHIYMKVFFNNDIRNDVQSMMKDIRQSLHTVLLEADWLDESTREAALLKESSMAEHIGRYEDTAMIKRLLAELKNLTFIEGNFEANNLNMNKFRQQVTRYNGLHHKQLSNTTKPLDLLIGMQVNSFYYNLDNAIYVMAGILHPPSFHQAWPNALKYGTLGFLVGHEFIHGFDSVGAKYDDAGSDNYWWSTKSGKVFEERSQCFAEHYENYTIPEINRSINGNMTKDENIADAGGIRMALLAYRRYVKDITKNSDTSSKYYKEEQMPGLDLTPEQLFFLGAAQLWCSAYKEAHYWQELSNEHTIDKYRALGIASNNADFAQVFNCPRGSNMNPISDKCQIW